MTEARHEWAPPLPPATGTPTQERSAVIFPVREYYIRFGFDLEYLGLIAQNMEIVFPNGTIPMTSDELGGIARTVRQAQGLRLDQLAGAAGVGTRFLSELERGKPTVEMGKVLSVLGALGCEVRIEAPRADPDGVTRVVATVPPWMVRARSGGLWR